MHPESNASMPRLVIVDPAHTCSVGHHGEVNRSLQMGLAQAGWQAELWADVALEASSGNPQQWRGVFSGCGYEDPRLWGDLAGMVQLARRLEQQLQRASGGGEAVKAWLAHSLLPFQLLGLARHLQHAPPALVLVSLMFAPGETLHGQANEARARANCRVALAALARSAQQGGHRIQLAIPSQQQEALYAPLLQGLSLPSAGVHPAVVGAGQAAAKAPSGKPPLVLLHWGDLRPSKGRKEAMAVLAALLQEGVPTALQGWGWLVHHHSQAPLPPGERQLLEQARDAGIGLEWLEGEIASETMQAWLGRCPVALLAHHPSVYGQRSSGLLWQWAASRLLNAETAVAVGADTGWLAQEARQLGLPWHPPQGSGGAAWLAALATASVTSAEKGVMGGYARLVLGNAFAGWCAQMLTAMDAELVAV